MQRQRTWVHPLSDGKLLCGLNLGEGEALPDETIFEIEGQTVPLTNENIELRGSLAVISGVKLPDAPAAWNAKFKDYFAVEVPDDRAGILQDIHWSGGLIGYFPTYTIGNLASVQLYEQAQAVLPDLPAAIEQGDFGPLLGWLRENVHCQGARYLPAELVEVVTGRPLTAEAYLGYLRAKYTDVYGL